MNVRAVDSRGSGNVCKRQRHVIVDSEVVAARCLVRIASKQADRSRDYLAKTGDCPIKNRGLSAAKSVHSLHIGLNVGFMLSDASLVLRFIREVRKYCAFGAFDHPTSAEKRKIHEEKCGFFANSLSSVLYRRDTIACYAGGYDGRKVSLSQLGYCLEMGEITMRRRGWWHLNAALQAGWANSVEIFRLRVSLIRTRPARTVTQE